MAGAMIVVQSRLPQGPAGKTVQLHADCAVGKARGLGHGLIGAALAAIRAAARRAAARPAGRRMRGVVPAIHKQLTAGCLPAQPFPIAWAAQTGPLHIRRSGDDHDGSEGDTHLSYMIDIALTAEFTLAARSGR